MPDSDTNHETTATLAVVVPVYQGAASLPGLIEELAALDWPSIDSSRRLTLTEVVLVHDGAIDDSGRVMEELRDRYEFVRPVWLSRNFGQHPATVAGIASTSADWIVTMDEDGLHDPESIAVLFETALRERADLVYGVPDSEPPHSRFRNLSSRFAKRVFRLLVGSEATETFTSFRLLDGVVARSLAAYYGADVYLDVALTWVVGKVAYQEVPYRPEMRPPSAGSGYNLRSLLSHFRRLVVTSGVRPLRFVAAIGVSGMLLGGITAVVVLAFRLFGDIPTQGWASVMIFVSLTSGLILFALGVVAEYLSSTLNMASGRPPYLTVHRPPRSSLRVDDHD